ncbi:unnamed protein product [Ceratitis capitata]|uniref:(Mediterranean fruit fly) hypothetical protein n=1 Tax=Ceratitis capitata TaxID=7213 RepID=A0A811U4I3_CERCA|nr:unnamed protein product [Ceratitis capitata]
MSGQAISNAQHLRLPEGSPEFWRSDDGDVVRMGAAAVQFSHWRNHGNCSEDNEDYQVTYCDVYATGAVNSGCGSDVMAASMAQQSTNC